MVHRILQHSRSLTTTSDYYSPLSGIMLGLDFILPNQLVFPFQVSEYFSFLCARDALVSNVTSSIQPLAHSKSLDADFFSNPNNTKEKKASQANDSLKNTIIDNKQVKNESALVYEAPRTLGLAEMNKKMFVSTQRIIYLIDAMHQPHQIFQR